MRPAGAARTVPGQYLNNVRAKRTTQVMRMKLVFTEVQGYRDRLREAFPNDELTLSDGPLGEEDLVEEAKGAEIISVFLRTQVGEGAIDSLPSLKMINTRTAGFDHIAAAHALDKGIAVTHVPDYGPHAIAEHAFCLLLACARHVIPADLSVKDAKRFDFTPFRGRELKGKTLGVVGTGRIGAEAIRIAGGFGMKVVAFDVYRNEALAREHGFEYRPLEEVLERSDFVTVHVPLTPDTEGLIGRPELQRMKKGSVLINTARGKVVDEGALKEALGSGHLYAAGADVLEDERRPESSPLLSSDQAVVTPHIAFYTEEAMDRMMDEAVRTIQEFREGRRVNEVPREYLKRAARPAPQG